MNKSYRDLLVWQKAMDLVVACYKITEYFPRREIYGLSSQLQRAAISIPANIAEGQGRGQRKEFQWKSKHIFRFQIIWAIWILNFFMHCWIKHPKSDA